MGENLYSVMKKLELLVVGDALKVSGLIKTSIDPERVNLLVITATDFCEGAVRAGRADFVVVAEAMCFADLLKVVRKVHLVRHVFDSRSFPLIFVFGNFLHHEMEKAYLHGVDKIIPLPCHLLYLKSIFNLFCGDRRVLARQSGIGAFVGGIIKISGAGNIVRFSKTAATVFKYRVSELIDKSFSLLLDQASSDVVRDFLAGDVPESESDFRQGMRLLGRDKSGELFPLHWVMYPVSEGDNRHFVAVIHDIKMEEEFTNMRNMALVC